MSYIVEAKSIGVETSILSLAGVGIGIGLIFSSIFIGIIISYLYTNNNTYITNYLSKQEPSINSDKTEEKTSDKTEENSSDKTKLIEDSDEIKSNKKSNNKINLLKLKEDLEKVDGKLDKKKDYYLLFLLLIIITSWCYFDPRCYNEIRSFLESLFQGDLRLAEDEVIPDAVPTDVLPTDVLPTEEMVVSSPDGSPTQELFDDSRLDVLNEESTQKDIIAIHW